MASRSRGIVGVAAVLALCLLLALPARAQTNPVPGHTLGLMLDSNTGSIFTGPAGDSFHMDFLLDDARRMADTPIGSTRDLEISLTSPNTPAFRFLFSPRPQFGIGFDPLSGTNRAYAGLTWDLFDAGSLFGHLGLASSFDPGLGGANPRRLDAAPLMFHGAVEFGYRFDPQNSLLFALDQGIAAGPRSGPAAVDDFTLRFGRKF
jgi:hypothetical protein